MKKGCFFLMGLLLMLLIGGEGFATDGKTVFFDPQLMPHTGKSFREAQDPEYRLYESALREYMVKQIQQRFGLVLDPKKYSGFDLLEIEALLKCKKAEESPDLFLKQFPRQP
jgi:hypothetical protein